MNPNRLPKGTQNRLKSAKMLPGTPPERVWRRSLEKIASQSLPETPSYASRTINTMVFSLPRKYPEAPFGLHFGSILEAFWCPKVGQGVKKAPPKKHRKTTPKKMPPGPKMEPKTVQIQAKSKPLLASFFLPPKKMHPGPKMKPKRVQIQTKSRPLLPMHARARWSSRRKSLPACSDFRRELHPTSLDHAFGNALTSFRLPACIQVVGGWGWKGGRR